MASRTYLHIGLPKTGTTHLQDVLWQARDILNAANVRLPMKTRQDQLAAVEDLVGTAQRTTSATWADLAGEVAEHDGTSIVSEELLASATEQHIAKAVNTLSATSEVHVVVTVRDLARLIPSAWQQRVRYRFTQPLEEYVETIANNPNHGFWARVHAPTVLTRWSSQLPPERIHVVTVPTNARHGSQLLWSRFATVVGVDTNLDTSESRTNHSLGVVQIEMLRRWNAALAQDQLPTPQPYFQVCREILLPVIPTKGAQPLGLAERWHHWVAEESENLIEQLNGSGYDIVGSLDDLKPDFRSQASPTDVSDADVLEVALGALAHMAEAHLSLGNELTIAHRDIARVRRKLRSAQMRIATSAQPWWRRKPRQRPRPGPSVDVTSG